MHLFSGFPQKRIELVCASGGKTVPVVVHVIENTRFQEQIPCKLQDIIKHALQIPREC